MFRIGPLISKFFHMETDPRTNFYGTDRYSFRGKPTLIHYLLVLLNISNGEEAGDEPELGVVEHHELGVGEEAVVALVS
jgi:hypothetical protein